MQDKKDTAAINNSVAVSKYIIGSKVFIVEHVFQKNGSETIGTALLRLMKEEMENK